VDQTKFGEEGNCFVACLASILEVGLEELAEVERVYLHGAAEWEAAEFRLRPGIYRRILREVNRVLVEDHKCILVTVSTMFGAPKGFAIAGGPGGRGLQHGVVFEDGVMVHDPEPSRAGLEGVEDYTILVKVVA
jgi:hypothetical protein